MTATEMLTKIAADVAAELPKVRNEYRTLSQGVALMRERGARTIEDAFYAEAKRRVFARA